MTGDYSEANTNIKILSQTFFAGPMNPFLPVLPVQRTENSSGERFHGPFVHITIQVIGPLLIFRVENKAARIAEGENIESQGAR